MKLKLGPVFEQAIQRTLATPPQPKSLIKKSGKKAAKGRRANPTRGRVGIDGPGNNRLAS